MSRIVVGPFNRVEGDLEVSLDVQDGVVAAAYVQASMFRGIELILQGKAPLDALVIAPRICGICSVSQSAAAVAALANAMHVQAPPNGRIVADLMQGVENLADHLSHFYLFFMPDFARADYAGRSWFAATHARHAAQTGAGVRAFLAARAALLRAMGLLAGRWPHSHAMQPGGVTRALQGSERIRLHHILREFRGFLQDQVFGDRLESVATLADRDALLAWAQGRTADFPRFLAIADDLDLASLGKGSGMLFSFQPWLEAAAPTVWRDGSTSPLAVSDIAEDVHRAWYVDGPHALAPARGASIPLAEKEGAYTWCKAPRIAGAVAETGALARQLLGGDTLCADLVRNGGANVMSRVTGRLIEAARLALRMEAAVDSLRPGDPYCIEAPLPDDAEGVGLVEAARGALGHWVRWRAGRIDHYQILAPTTWNFSPRDANGVPGPLEQALVGAPAIQTGDAPPVAVQHIVRSFDPCMVCTVH